VADRPYGKFYDFYSVSPEILDQPSYLFGKYVECSGRDFKVHNTIWLLLHSAQGNLMSRDLCGSVRLIALAVLDYG
jgi:hypothetical protein